MTALSGADLDRLEVVARAGTWLPISEAPHAGEMLTVRYEDGSEESDVYWSDVRYCMLGAPQGSCGPGWLSTEAGNLPVDAPALWLFIDHEQIALIALARRAQRMEVALRPFAEAADDLDDDAKDRHEIWENPAAMSITCGDIRRARAILSEPGA